MNIELNGSDVSDSDLKILSRYDHLVRLSLSNTRITDAGLIHLHSLKQLRFVGLYSTNVTEEGLNALGKENPALTIGTFDKRFDRIIDNIVERFEVQEVELLPSHGSGPSSENARQPRISYPECD